MISHWIPRGRADLLRRNGVSGAVDWARLTAGTGRLPIGLFGARKGAAAAHVAATDPQADTAAAVPRDVRPDLALSHVSAARCPTLLSVGDDIPTCAPCSGTPCCSGIVVTAGRSCQVQRGSRNSVLWSGLRTSP